VSSARVFTENDGESALVEIALFDRMERADAIELMRRCCASRRWIGEVVSGRPYWSMRRLIAASDDVLDDLNWPDLAEALAAQPRVGEEVIAGAGAYEQRFGHVFVACPTGRTMTDLRAALQQRLGNPTDVERQVVRAELRAIVRLRLITTFR
jgi:2-oxo-4-hydroxy-4-carboxy-5-ureidoimidazoline decarboxylase